MRSFQKLVASLFLLKGCSAWIFQPFSQIQQDYLALTRRVTARHILLPKSDEVCLVLKQKIRNKDEFIYLVDAFEQAAKRYSKDETTSARGGLLGELVPQGYCRIPELDRACFSLRLGIVEGPIESEFGYHLILVTERTNCPKLDGKNTKLVRKKGSNDAILVPSPQVGQVGVEFVAGQVVFWIFCLFAGGTVAELAAQVGSGIGMKM
jgi:peptidyl-prolyl cis-trans isomerase C